MPLDKETLQASIESDLNETITQSLTDSREALSLALRDSNGGFYSALSNIKLRAESMVDSVPPSEFAQVLQTTVSEEFAKAISSKMIEALNSTWVKKLSLAIATCISSRIDAYIKSAEIVVPPGASVYVPTQYGGAGASAGQAHVQEASSPATIS